jgi:hypothetical protein
MAQLKNYGSLIVAPCDSLVLASWTHIPGYHLASARYVLGYGESLQSVINILLKGIHSPKNIIGYYGDTFHRLVTMLHYFYSKVRYRCSLELCDEAIHLTKVITSHLSTFLNSEYWIIMSTLFTLIHNLKRSAFLYQWNLYLVAWCAGNKSLNFNKTCGIFLT